MERTTIFPLNLGGSEKKFPLFRYFTSTVPVLSVFPPLGEPFGFAVNKAVVLAGSAKNCDLLINPAGMREFGMVICRQAMGGADLSFSISQSGDGMDGVLLNDLAIGDCSPRPLSHRDVLRICDWVIRVVVPTESQPGFEGDLACFPILSLLQACADQDADIRLLLRTANRNATVFFHGGRVVHAEFREPGNLASGEAAFRRIIEISTGSFWVSGQSVAPAKRTLDHSLDKLFLSLFEAAETDIQTGDMTFDFTPEKPAELK
jgi:Domain of unknown function (DUF4388)